MSKDLANYGIANWKSILTLVLYILSNSVIVYPFHLSVYIPRKLSNSFYHLLNVLRVTSTRADLFQLEFDQYQNDKSKAWSRLRFPVNHITGPLAAIIVLIAVKVIDGKQLHDGIIGTEGIYPYDIILFFLSQAYIALSLTATGLFRYLLFKTIQKAGNVGHKLFMYLYIFLFGFSVLFGNGPVVLFSTETIIYLVRVSRNILIPRAWIYTQFAITNIGSTILVPSNPTNLIIVGAFHLNYFHYTANTVVPVTVTAIVLFPILLFVIFADEALIPLQIQLSDISPELKERRPVNPNIPHAFENHENLVDDNTKAQSIAIEEILNPFLDIPSAIVGAVIMGLTTIALLVLGTTNKTYHLFWVTIPAAILMLCWDIGFGWYHRKQTRAIARQNREANERSKLERINRQNLDILERGNQTTTIDNSSTDQFPDTRLDEQSNRMQQSTLVSLVESASTWSQETFPAATAVLSRLPVSFAISSLITFVLIQALVDRGWILVLAHGWDSWVNKTGTMGAIGGMSFLSIIICNFSGTNIGASILLCRLVQSWTVIHQNNGTLISNRTFWGSVYSIALGVNFGAFSMSVIASPAGILWQNILASKHVFVQYAFARPLNFARVNVPIISTAMAIASTILVGEVFIMRNNNPHDINTPFSPDTKVKPLQVICSWPVSGGYGPGPRMLYYVLVATYVFSKKAEWLRDACLATALLFPAAAAFHGIVLAAVHVDGAVDMDIYGAFQACSIGIMAAPLTVRLSRTYFSDRGRNAIFLWTSLNLAGLLSLTVEFYRSKTYDCIYDPSGNSTLFDAAQFPYDKDINCGLICSVDQGPFSPLRRGSADNIYVVPAPDKLTLGTATVLAAASCIPALLSVFALWIRILEQNWVRTFGNIDINRRILISGGARAPIEGIDETIKSLLFALEVPVFTAGVLAILVLGEMNFFSPQVFRFTESAASIGQWAPIITTLGSLYLLMVVDVQDTKKKTASSNVSYTDEVEQDVDIHDHIDHGSGHAYPVANSFTNDNVQSTRSNLPTPTEISTPPEEAHRGLNSFTTPSNRLSPFGHSNNQDSQSVISHTSSRLKVTSFLMSIERKLSSNPQNSLNDSKFRHGQTSNFPEIPGESSRNPDLFRIREQYNRMQKEDGDISPVSRGSNLGLNKRDGDMHADGDVPHMVDTRRTSSIVQFSVRPPSCAADKTYQVE